MGRNSRVAKEVERVGNARLADVPTVEGVGIRSDEDSELGGTVGIIPFRIMALNRDDHREKEETEKRL